MPQLLTDDTIEIIVTESAKELIGRLQQVIITARSFDRHLIDTLEQVVYDHRARFKSVHGTAVSFPEMVPFFLPSLRFIAFERRDLTNQEIRAKLVQLVRDFANKGIRLEAVEFAAAITRVWPWYKPPIEEIRQDPRTQNQLQ